MPVAKPLNLRLFLEGIEVPVIAAQVSININSPAVASVQIIPLDEALDFKPRTMIHLFFLDHFNVRPSDDPNVDDKKNPNFLKNYKLLFSGEVVGFALSKQPNARSLVLQCMDFSSYWDSCHATAISYGPNGNAFVNSSALYGSNSSLFDDVVNFQSEQLSAWLRQSPQTPGLQSVGGLAGGVIRMLEAIGGVPSHSKGVNDFFTVAELRCKLLAQITAEENDSTAANILQDKVFWEWLMNGLQNMGTQVTFRDMLKLLFRYIYYDVVPNPTAKYDPDISGITKEVVSTGSSFRKSPLAVSIVTRLKEIRAETTNIGIQDRAFKASLTALAAELKIEIKRIKSLVGMSQSARSAADKASTKAGLALAVMERLAQQDTNVGVGEAGNLLDECVALLDEWGNSFSTSSKTIVTTTRSARLRTQIIRPDCWFAAPPRCNVIFPEHFTSLSYDRSFVGETTRLLVMVYNGLVGRDELLADKVLAPNIGATDRSLTKKSGSSSYRLLMDHELHTGIVPRSEWLPNTNVSTYNKTISNNMKKVRGARLDWSSKVAMFNFFKYRIGPRQASVAGAFNPYLVAGFPAVVIQRPAWPGVELEGGCGTSSRVGASCDA